MRTYLYITLAAAFSWWTVAALSTTVLNHTAHPNEPDPFARRVLTTLNGQAGVAASSLCFLPSRAILSGPIDCPDGEAQLLGQYVNLGIHNAGSFGTNHSLDATYFTGQFGFIADFDRNGFATSSPGYSGDYFNSGTFIEGS